MENDEMNFGLRKGFTIKLKISKPLDSLLLGGVEAGALTNFCGPPGSGKTNICMLAAISAVESGKKVIYIDTEGGFSFERFQQLAKENTDKILNGIMFLEPRTFKEQEEAIKKCKSLVLKDEFS